MDAGDSGGGTSVPRWWRPGLALAAGCAISGLVAGCVSQEVADTANRRLNHGMSTSELRIADRTALHRARDEDARVTARATVSGSETSSSSHPRPCTTGRLLHITLAGRFPHQPSSADSGATEVTGEELTVDATTGHICESHYLTGTIAADPSSVLLFSS